MILSDVCKWWDVFFIDVNVDMIWYVVIKFDMYGFIFCGIGKCYV